MAAPKKSVEALERELNTAQKRKQTAEEQLRRCREIEKKLRARLAEAKAGELLNIIETRELTFEAAKDILAAAKQDGEELKRDG